MALTRQEMQCINQNLSSTCTIASGGIARLYLASPDPRSSPRDPSSVLHTFPKLSSKNWTFTNVMGALVLIIDRQSDAFLFQIYDLETFVVRFEYELYFDIQYIPLDALMHSFEMEDCMAGFSFTDEQVASQFQSKVRALAPSTKQDAPVNLFKKNNLSKKKTFFGGLFSKEKKPTFTIGAVTHVQHKQHLGMNVDGTFDIENLTPEWKKLFKEAGIRKKDLRNPDMVDTIRGVMEESGVSLQEPPRNVPKEELSAVYNEEQMAQYEVYQAELQEYERQSRLYEEEVLEYKKEAKLSKWEEDNKSFIQKSKAEKKKPPPLPPRKRANTKHGKPKTKPALPHRPKPPQIPALPPVKKERKHDDSRSEPNRRPTKGGGRRPTGADQRRKPRRDSNNSKPHRRKPRGQDNPQQSHHQKLPHTSMQSSKTEPTMKVQRKFPPVPEHSQSATSMMTKLSNIRRSSFNKLPNSPIATFRKGAQKDKTPPEKPPRPGPKGEPKAARPQSRFFLNAIKDGQHNLKKINRVSKLPNLKSIKPKAQNTIMMNLKKAMDERRMQIDSTSVDDSDSDSDWSID